MTQIARIDKIKSILPSLVEWINLLSTIYLISTFILSFDFQRPAIFAYIISTIADISVNKRYKNIKWDSTKWIFIVMIGLYLSIWVWHIFETCNSPQFFHSTDKRLPFMIFGLLGIFTYPNPKIKISHIAICMLITSIATIAYIIIDNYSAIQENVSNIYDYREKIGIFRNTTLEVTHIEFNLYLNCAIALCFITATRKKLLWQKIVFYIGILIIYTHIITSEGRVGFITSNALLLFFICIIAYRNRTKLLIPTLVIATIAIALFVSRHNRFQSDILKNEPRILIWQQAIDLIKEQPTLGYGLCDSHELFVTKSLENEKLVANFWNNWMKEHPQYDIHRFHCHNIFIESTLEFGIVGLVLTCMLFVLPLMLTRDRKRLYLSFFVLIFGIQGMFESFTSHYQIFLFCWLLYFFITRDRDQDTLSKGLNSSNLL
jgi:O-antigen ligase